MTDDTYRQTLLLIGAQHPASSSNPDDKLVQIFNQLTTLARAALGAVGDDEDDKADWCSAQAEAATTDDPAIVLFGNPVDGYSIYGPFVYEEAAITWAENQNEKDWWVTRLEKPES